MTTTPHTQAAPARYVTLAEARALECNGCGDCCDSRRTDGFWTWGALPADQYRAQADGQPLIIPIERIHDGWQDRPHDPADQSSLSGTRFRCAAFQPQEDGRGLCGRHGQWRPQKCGEFPVWGADIEDELAATGLAVLHVGAFPRCTWHGMTVVREGDERLPPRA